MIKDYKEETLYLAVSIADRFLVNVVILEKKLPDLLTLVVVCTLLSAKLEEALQPSFKKMIRLVDEIWQIKIDLTKLKAMEIHILQLF